MISRAPFQQNTKCEVISAPKRLTLRGYSCAQVSVSIRTHLSSSSLSLDLFAQARKERHVEKTRKTQTARGSQEVAQHRSSRVRVIGVGVRAASFAKWKAGKRVMTEGSFWRKPPLFAPCRKCKISRHLRSERPQAWRRKNWSEFWEIYEKNFQFWCRSPPESFHPMNGAL